MLEAVDGSSVRTWARACLAALGRAREEIDALNVFPVPDGDTGTNLYLTFDAACERLDELERAGDAGSAGAAAALGALADGALEAAHGNSGAILAQLLRGLAEELAATARSGGFVDPGVLAAALARADVSARAAVSRPVEGTMLSVVRAAAVAAGESVRRSADAGAAPPAFAAVAEAARQAAATALRETQHQLAVLAAAGVVDAGGRGVCVFLDVLAALVGGYDPRRVESLGAAAARRSLLRPVRVPAPSASRGAVVRTESAAGADPGLELVFLIDTESIEPLRAELERICAADGGDSLVIAGGAGRYRVHIHLHQPGPAIEAALDHGRPRDLRVTALAECVDHGGTVRATPRTGRVVLAAADGPGLAALFTEVGAVPLAGPDGRPPTSAQLSRAVLDADVREVVIVTADRDGLAGAFAAADQAERDLPGVRVAVIPGKAAVQAVAALAVHEPGRRFDADVVAMTAAAGATRYGALRLAEDEAWTMAGVACAGDVLGFIEDDVAVIAESVLEAALGVVDRMVSAGGEMVTLVTGADLGLPTAALVDAVTTRVLARRPEMDVVAYAGGQAGWLLLIGVE
ncbi:DAK2 domain-containing protein [Actinospica durhamensis]|uniref:DAK2 domain-containing protein n=1 Tax=Actinospica durhamensis TaxID=1508375 RepID=A0A941ESI0_9ACTN|nr:DAK2 domain-containing protein [Actinospica durhamensis]MBR7833044.1 DAK2 domain-containing protein [Actinospica durhamensis]